MPSFINRTFAGGEIAPSLQVRGDQIQYQTGVNLARNMTVVRDGTVKNRQGFGFIRHVVDQSIKNRVIDWVFNNSLSYVLELGDMTMRFIRNGAPIVVNGVAAYNAGTTYVIGDLVESAGIIYYSMPRGENLGNDPAVSPTLWFVMGPAGDTPMMIPTPWPEADLLDVQYDQQGDIMYLVHPSFPPQELVRSSDTGWTLVDFIPNSLIDRTFLSSFLTVPAVGIIRTQYIITATFTETFEESLPGTCATAFTILSATATDPVVVQVNGIIADIMNGDAIYISGYADAGMPEINKRSFVAANIVGDTLELLGEDGSGYNAGVGGGQLAPLVLTANTVAPTEAAPFELTTIPFLSDPGNQVAYYNYYKNSGAGFGFVGTASIINSGQGIGQTYFVDPGIEPDLSIRPPIDEPYFQRADDYPSTVQFVQQRLIFAASNNMPQTIWFSRIGSYDNFTTSPDVTANDAINFILSGRSIDRVVHVVDASGVIVLSESSEWLIRGDANGTIRATAINANQIGFDGATQRQPIVLSNTTIYVQARGMQIRSINFNEQIQGYDPNNLGRWALHLFEDNAVRDWAYQRLPDSVFWMVMADGTAVSMTYIVDEDIVAFCRHDTDGIMESVCVVPEGINDVVYITVARQINGVTVRNTERMPTRSVKNIITDAYFMDSFVASDGTNTGIETITLNSAGGWGVDDGPFDLTSTGGPWTGASIGNAVVLSVGEETLSCLITAFNDISNVAVSVSKDVPVAFQNVALLTYCFAFDEFSGLDHLEGETVSVLADGNVLTPVVVSGGSVTLPNPYCVVRFGLPYRSELETLDLEMADNQTLQDKRKRFNNMTMIVQNTRGGWAGPDQTHVHEVKQLLPNNWNTPQEMLVSGRVENILQGAWQDRGRLFIQQRDPLPMHILGLVPHGVIGG